MNEIKIFAKSIKDFFTKPILQIAIYPLLITFAIMFVFFFLVADMSLDGLKNYAMQVQEQQILIENGEQIVANNQTQTFFGKDIIDFLLQYSITAWIVSFLIYTVGTVFIMMFSLFITVAIIGFFTPMILSIIQKRYYPQIEFKGYGNIFNTIGTLIKSLFVMILLFIILIPFYFIPVLNLLVLNIPLYYFFYKLLNFDITSTIMTKEEEAIVKVKNAYSFHFRTILLYFISMIPFIVLFTTVFYIMYLGHNYFIELKKVREF